MSAIKNAISILASVHLAEKKLDPKAKTRNRGTVCFPAKSPNVKDHKDHFPINNAGQARNALSRAGAFTKAPAWYKGSLSSFKATIHRKVKGKYPSIKVSD